MHVLLVPKQVTPVPGEVSALVLCHTRELAWQIAHEYDRFSKYLPDIKVRRPAEPLLNAL